MSDYDGVPGLDVRLDEIVIKALEKRPERRYQQASEVKTDVEAIASAPPPATSPANPGPPVRILRWRDAWPWNWESLQLFLIVPLAVIAALIAVANREDVVFRFNPFAPDDPVYATTMPLFALVFLAFLAGTLVGGVTFAQGYLFGKPVPAAMLDFDRPAGNVKLSNVA